MTPPQQDAFDRLWHWYPEELTPFSSLWWYFLLFPRQEEGYGPKQIMFTLVSRVGERVRINHVPHTGITHRRPAGSVESPFPGMALGWIYDGQQMHDGLLQTPCTLQVEAGQAIKAWDEEGYGGQIVGGNGSGPENGNSRPFAVEALYRGRRGEAHFEVWGDPVSEMTTPTITRRDTIVGNADVLAWRHLHFAGEFTSPAGTERLEGVGYFQRICLNIMPFPWKWMWAAFADGSIFSCFVPFLGPHLLRRGDWFFPSRLENLTLPIQGNAYFARSGSWETVEFKQVQVKTLLGHGPYPDFLVSCRRAGGDFFQFRAVSHAHTQVLLDRSLLGPLSSRYNYNEYLFRIEDLAASIGGNELGPEQLGTGFGNCEYTWGLGL